MDGLENSSAVAFSYGLGLTSGTDLCVLVSLPTKQCVICLGEFIMHAFYRIPVGRMLQQCAHRRPLFVQCALFAQCAQHRWIYSSQSRAKNMANRKKIYHRSCFVSVGVFSWTKEYFTSVWCSSEQLFPATHTYIALTHIHSSSLLRFSSLYQTWPGDAVIAQNSRLHVVIYMRKGKCSARCRTFSSEMLSMYTMK